MRIPATNRQKKVLRFFKIVFSPEISKGAAGWEIGRLFVKDGEKDKWKKYVYLTGDDGDETDQLQDYDPSVLEEMDLPEQAPSRQGRGKTNLTEDEVAAIAESPFDDPQPEITFSEALFVFTGKLSFGSRKEWRQAVIEKGGTVEDIITTSADYLVVGEKGNPQWKRDSYGRKIEKAINFRRNHGKPAIVRESIWKAALGLSCDSLAGE